MIPSEARLRFGQVVVASLSACLQEGAGVDIDYSPLIEKLLKK